MKKWHKYIITGMFVFPVQLVASPFSNFGGSNGWGGSDDCSDWPEWTPMYWMEEMMGDNDCYSSPAYFQRPNYMPPRLPQQSRYQRPSYQSRQPSGYPVANYQRPRQLSSNNLQSRSLRSPVSPYGAYPASQRAPQRAVNPAPYSGYADRYQTANVSPYADRGYAADGYQSPYRPAYQPSSYRPSSYQPSYYQPSYQQSYRGRRAGLPSRSNRQFSRGSRFGQGFSPLSGRSSGFPAMSSFGTGFSPMGGGFSPSSRSFGTGFNPMGSGSSFGMPMSTGMSPMGFGSPVSPMSGVGGMNPMSPMSPMGFGSPVSTMNPMSSINPINPMGGGFGGSPFGGSGMSPFSGGMGSPFSF